MNYFVGLSLASNSAADTGLAIIDEYNTLIKTDKFYTMNDIIYFFDNYSSLKQSKICISLAWDRTMLNGKWRVLSKPYQLVSTNSNMPNIDNWTQRYSPRGCDYFKTLEQRGAEIKRFELYLTRQNMKLNSCYRERTPADCKFLQQTLKIEWGIDLPVNMMPMSQLEAIVGAILAKENTYNKNNIKTISTFKDFDVIDVINCPQKTFMLY